MIRQRKITCLFVFAFRYKNRRKYVILYLLSGSSNERSFFMQTISKTKKIILSAMLLAMTIVLSRFLSINTQLLVIGFSFIPMVLAAIWLGPKYAAIICGLADLIGALLFPFGTFFIGFTISAICKGLIYGLILYKKGEELTNKQLMIRLIIACILVILSVHLLMNAIWLVIMYDRAFSVVLAARVVPELIMIPIQVITIFALINALRPITKKYLED